MAVDLRDVEMDPCRVGLQNMDRKMLANGRRDNLQYLLFLCFYHSKVARRLDRWPVGGNSIGVHVKVRVG